MFLKEGQKHILTPFL